MSTTTVQLDSRSMPSQAGGDLAFGRAVIDKSQNIRGDVGDTAGDGNMILGAGASYIESTSDELASLVVERSTDLAARVSDSAYDFAKMNAELSAQQNARFWDFADKQNDLTESTRIGNQQLAADMTARALELSEKRTGSDSDKAAETVSGLVRLAVIAAAVLGALALLFRNSPRASK